MVARKKSDEGKRVTVCVKVSEADAAAIDASRGGLTRSAWGRGLFLAAVYGDAAEQVRPGQQRREGVSRPVPPSSVSPEPAPARMESAPGRERCPHPKARVLKGTCRACMTYVGKG